MIYVFRLNYLLSACYSSAKTKKFQGVCGHLLLRSRLEVAIFVGEAHKTHSDTVVYCVVTLSLQV